MAAEEKDMLNSIQRAYSRIKLELEPPAATIALHHPRLNVIDTQMVEDLLAALQHIRSREDVSVVVLSGGERDFSAGTDIREHLPESAGEMIRGFHRLIGELIALPAITVAVVRGNCLGGGAELALMCDLVFCTEDSRWGFPEINLGCFPPAAAVALAQSVGQKRAAELILTGNIIDGDQAFAIGMVNDAVPEDELDELVRDVAGRLASLSPAALALAKKALYATPEFEQALKRSESIYLDELIQTADAREGVLAWMEKRPPRWTGE